MNLLNIDSSTSNEQFSSKHFENTSQNSLMCKIIRYMPSTTLISLQRNQTCNCLIYLVYKSKEFHFNKLRWDYMTPFCYRKQIRFDYDGAKSFDAIIQREKECDLDGLIKFCYPPPKTTTISTTPVTSTLCILILTYFF